MTTLEEDQTVKEVMRAVTPGDVKRMLKGLAEGMKTSEQETLRAMLQQMIEKVELSPATFEAAVYFRLGPAKSGERMASPRGFEPRFIP